MAKKLFQVDLTSQLHYRIIPSTFPPINFFEELVDPAEMDILLEIENLTNERIRQQVGEIFLVPPEDRVSGAGSSVVMAAFTHIYKPSRFTDGSFGIYYAGLSYETAIRETVYHREVFLNATKETAGEIAMRVYEGQIAKTFVDVRGAGYKNLHHASDFTKSQLFGQQQKTADAWGIIYKSVRHAGGECIAALRPHAITIPKQIAHLKYLWDGKRIATVVDNKVILNF